MIKPIQWTTECDSVFFEVTEILCRKPVLAMFHPSKKTSLFTDASVLVVGTVLHKSEKLVNYIQLPILQKVSIS